MFELFFLIWNDVEIDTVNMEDSDDKIINWVDDHEMVRLDQLYFSALDDISHWRSGKWADGSRWLLMISILRWIYDGDDGWY